MVQKLKQKVMDGKEITKEEAMTLAEADLDELCQAADEIRKHFCGNVFDICSCINVKGGKCSEDCKFCPQSCFNDKVEVKPHTLIGSDQMLEEAAYMAQKGVVRCDLVSSGRRLPKDDVRKIVQDIERIRKETGIAVCCSFGLLDQEDCEMLRKAGITRLHNNLESSRTFFTGVCSSHSTDDKMATLRAARATGLTLCSGCLINLGESMEDRIELALMERELGVKSIPVNVLNPIKDSPFEDRKPMTNEEFCRTVAVFRFLLPDASIRLAAGRIYLADHGKRALSSGANAAITGDFLMTGGMSIDSDMAMAKELGYEPGLWK
ncbi:biotin synthase BioB [Roseburia sp. AM59-24XD]|uniref:biotin synthase BioB n=1 Tax=Roseburia sp. AM59-24XD TaxID=2293138 RepID=UPI000E4A4FEE|nr:biotin synthase BioB [Roseburia sp. AM59-24XD]RHP79638.1 biotin synthase BioB [Roseburia sp. AM59-24XD]